jgi:hypothetical protein
MHWMLSALTRAFVFLAIAAILPSRAASDCPGPVVRPEQLARDVWLVEASGGEASLLNGGFVSNLVVVRTASGAWLTGTGPSPAFGAALRCQLREVLGREVSDVFNPWAHAEVVLGAKAFDKARVHGLDSVAAQMKQQCTACINTLRENTGPARDPMAAEPVYPSAATTLKGDQGQVGPFEWWRRARAPQADVLVLHHRESGVWVAPGLFWGRAVPDLRGAGLSETIGSLRWLIERMGAKDRVVGEQGGALPREAVQAQLDYVLALQQAVDEALRSASFATSVQYVELPQYAAWAHYALRHPLNCQRAWREAEAAWLKEGGTPSR